MNAQPAAGGYANGFKPKRISTRLGRARVAIPQVRGEVELYASALEEGTRSQHALELAMAEMCVRGVSSQYMAMEHLAFDRDARTVPDPLYM